MNEPARDWVRFWDTAHSIYVNARHRDVHSQLLARHARGYVPAPEARLLDYGCGRVLHADQVAAAAGHLTLCDAAPGVRAELAARYAGNPKIDVQSPEDVAALPDGTFDLVLMVSVAQYVTPVQLDELLAVFRRLLNPSGLLVLGDVVPPSVSPLADAAALLRFGRQEGFLGAAVIGLVRTAFSDYRKLRTRLGLTFYEAPAMLAKLHAAGFDATRAPKNIGHNQARMTFTARRKGGAVNAGRGA